MGPLAIFAFAAAIDRVRGILQSYKQQRRWVRIIIWVVITGLPTGITYITFFQDRPDSKTEIAEIVRPQEPEHGILVPANDPGPQHDCKDAQPDNFKIFFGGNLSWSVQHRQVTALNIYGRDIITLTAKPGGYALSANLYRQSGREVAKIVNNQWVVNPFNYYRLDGTNRHELNVFDKDNQRVLHVRYLNETTFLITGTFYAPDHDLKIVATDDAVLIGHMYVSGNCTRVIGPGSGQITYFTIDDNGLTVGSYERK